MLRLNRLLMAGSVAVVLAAAAGTAWWFGVAPSASGTRTVSEAEARAVLAARVQLLAKRDRAAYCGDDDPLCDSHWNRAGGEAAVPGEPPQVLGSRVVDGVQVLVLCGRDGLGRPYRSDFPVDVTEGRMHPPLAVFWRSVRYNGDHPNSAPLTVTPEPPGGTASAPPECG